LALREGFRSLGRFPARERVQFCARRSDFKDLGHFFCNANQSSRWLQNRVRPTILIFIQFIMISK
jgi:hypothetical protein